MTRLAIFILCFVAASALHATQSPFWVEDEAINQNFEDIFSKDSQNVKLSGEQTITGTKKFSQIGTSGDPVNQVYVDSITLTNAGGLSVNGETFRYVPWTSYTPTIVGFGSTSIDNIFYRIIGDTMEIQGSFLAGTCTGVEGYITLPTGYTIDSSKLPNGLNEYGFLGTMIQLDNGGNTLFTTAFTALAMFPRNPQDGRIYITDRGEARRFDPQNVTSYFTNGNRASFHCSFPID